MGHLPAQITAEGFHLMDILGRQIVEPHHDELHDASVNSYCDTMSCKRNWIIIFAVALLLEGILFGYIALLLRRFACISTSRFRQFLHFANVAGGGVFLANGLLHILPEAVELLSHKPEEHNLNTKADGGAKEHGEGHGEHAHQFPTASAIILGVYFAFLFFDRVLFTHSECKQDHLRDGMDKSEDAETSLQELFQNDEQKLNGFRSSEFLSSVITVAGIFAHSLFESIALGSSPNFSSILNTFIAISTHHWATSMALGSRFAKDKLSAAPYAVLTGLFSLISPLGIGIGFAVKETSKLFQGVIFALSAGTFIYIGAFETTAKEFVEHKKCLFAKFFCMLSGAGLMLAITGILSVYKIR